MVDLKEIADNVIKGQASKVKELVQQAIDAKTPVKEILEKGLIAGMNVVGAKFKNNEFYVPEVLIAARAMHAGMNLLKPLLVSAGIKLLGTVVVGTVKGDLHDIGKNLVSMMLQGAGFNVVDIGIDVTPEKFASAVKENNAGLVAMSALLTTTMISMKPTIDLLKGQGINVKTMIGGAPVTQTYADEIGANGYAADAASAVDTAKQLLGI
ncbi:MAG: corrinoid protein [Candidatus Firestonebacteria bacterium]